MGLFDKLGFGLKKTKDGIFNSITKTIISSPLTDELYDDLLEQLILADVNADNKIIAADARSILRVSAGIDPELGTVEI